MNNIHPTIKFTFDASDQTHFLDVSLQLNQNHIETEVYTKPTDSHAYLLPSSCHPKHSFKGIVYSQALRVKRICSNKKQTDHHLNNLQEHFEEREYDPHMIQQQINRANEKQRQELLKYKTKPNDNRDRVFFPITYSPATSTVSKIIHKHFPQLHQSPTMHQTFPQPPTTSYRRARSLRDLLVRARDPSPLPAIPQSGPHNTPAGFFKCPSTKCAMHTHINETTTFKSSTTGQVFPIQSHITCKSDWAIYLITCSQCQKQYVGKTETTIYTRFSNTRSEIRNQLKKLPYTAHFNLPLHSVDNAKITGIEIIHNKSHNTILHRESFWIAKLKTLHPHGINVDP